MGVSGDGRRGCGRCGENHGIDAPAQFNIGAMRTPGRIRIIGGSLRGSRLDVPDRPGLRPTPDRLRETLFNWLQPLLPGSRVLDLFSGSGALALEALSRGAASAVAVERDRELARRIADNAVRLRVPNLEVVGEDALTWLARGPARAFDLVFLDPPFDLDLWTRAAAALEAGGWLAPGARVYVETPRDVSPRLPRGWTLQREARAGDVCGALWRASVEPVREH
jgi:16S rRNA (guanine966-N2)-methyltransferase